MRASILKRREPKPAETTRRRRNYGIKIPCYVEVDFVPLCKVLFGSFEGCIVASAAKVWRCEFQSMKDAKAAIKRLRPHFQHGTRFYIVPGTCREITRILKGALP